MSLAKLTGPCLVRQAAAMARREAAPSCGPESDTASEKLSLSIEDASAKRKPAGRTHRSAGRAPIWALVGAGGKTTVGHRFTEALTREGLRAVFTTTTHLAPEPHFESTAELARFLEGERPAAAARRPVFAHLSGDIMQGPTPAEWENLQSMADILVVEADGSRRHPFKIPAPHEPALPPAVDVWMIVFGLSAIGRPLAEVFHRRERLGDYGLADFGTAKENAADSKRAEQDLAQREGAKTAQEKTTAAGSSPERILTPGLAAEALIRGYLLPLKERTPEARLIVLANQADAIEAVYHGEEVFRAMQRSLKARGLDMPDLCMLTNPPASRESLVPPGAAAGTILHFS